MARAWTSRTLRALLVLLVGLLLSVSAGQPVRAVAPILVDEESTPANEPEEDNDASLACSAARSRPRASLFARATGVRQPLGASILLPQLPDAPLNPCHSRRNGVSAPLRC